MGSVHRVTLAACACVALAACAVNPVTGRPEVTTMSTARETSLGTELSELVAEHIGLVDDPRLAAYVSAIGQRIAARSPRQDIAYHFAVADMREPNAFALPGGWVYVSRGLLVIAGTEAELANVIGHEVGHVAARHAAARETRSIGAGALAALGAVVSGVTLGLPVGREVGGLFQIAGAGLIASYSRGQEHQADEIGQRLAAEAGWDPLALSRFLQTLDRDSALHHEESARPDFLSSHPVTAARVEQTRARAAELTASPASPIARDRAEFLGLVAGLLVGPDPAEGVFREARFLHPELRFVIDFPGGWETANSPQAVGAMAPDEDAVVVLVAQEKTADPQRAAERFAQANGIALAAGETLRIGGFPAYRAVTQVRGGRGPVGLDLTWVAHPAATFRITGMSPVDRFGEHRARIAQCARSFRPISERELASIRELQLQIAAARDGERFADLTRRTGNQWSPEETAIANGLELGARLSEGQLVKIAVEVPYAP